MSVQCSSRSAFGRPTGNDVSGHYKPHYFGTSVRHSSGLHRAVSFGRSTASNDVVATILISLFFSSVFFLRHLLFSYKECLDPKTFFSKVDGSAHNPMVNTLTLPPMGGPQSPLPSEIKEGVIFDPMLLYIAFVT